MADNVIADPGAGGASFATDDIAGVHYPRSKQVWGADGVATDVAAGASALPVQDGGNSLTVDGTVTANAGTGPWPVTDNGGSLTVDGTVSVSGTVTVDSELTTGDLDTGAGTDTRAVVGLVGSASGGGQIIPGSSTDGLLVNLGANNDVTVTGTVTANLAAGTNNIGDVDILSIAAGDNNIGNVDVVTLPALPAGTNNIGDVDVLTLPALPAGTNNIGDVDIVSAPGNYAEDAAHVSGDVGRLVLGVRRDANTSLVGTDGDYAPFQVDANGSLKVNITAGAGSGGTSATDDAAFTPASGSGTPIMGFADETTPDSVDEGDVGVVRMTLSRGLHVNLRNASGTELTPSQDATHDSAALTTGPQVMGVGSSTAPTAVSANGDAVRLWATTSGALNVADGGGTISIDDGAGSITVDGTVTANLAAGTNNIGDVDVLTLPALPAGTNNIGDVDVLTLPGTFAEDAAHTTADLGHFVLGVRRDANTTFVSADGDYSPLAIDANGNLKVNMVAGGGSGGTSSTDEAAYTPASSVGTPIMGAADETAPDAAAEGTLAIIRSTLNRALHVNLRDAAGAEVAVGGGTQYTEDAAAAANPVGTALVLVREDARAGGLTSADGDNVAARGTNAGELYVKHVDAIPVTDNGGSLTVDGTVTAAQATAANLNATVVGTGTFAVQVSSLPASTNTIEIVGDAAHDAAVAGNPVLIGAEFDDTAPDAVDEGDVGRLRISANRNLYSTIRDAAGNERGVNVNASNQLSVSVDNTVTVASHAVTNAGTFATQVDGAALTALQLIDNSAIADDAAFTPATTGVTMAGFFADETSTDSVDEGDGGAARMTLDRKLIVVPQPHTAGGLSIFRSLDLDETEEEVKATAGCVYSVWVTNTATATRWLKFYNATAANVTVGTTTPVITIGIPGNTTDDISGNFGPGGVGIMFDTAITVAATTGVADADTGAPAANDVIVNVFYK